MARRPHKTLHAMLLKLGLVPPDTKFNRRAKEYADYAVKLAAAEKHSTKKARAANAFAASVITGKFEE